VGTGSFLISYSAMWNKHIASYIRFAMIFNKTLFLWFTKISKLQSRPYRHVRPPLGNQLRIRMSGTHVGNHRREQWRTQEFCLGGGGVSTNSVEDTGQRERGFGGGSPPFRGSGGSCNLVQEISLHIVKFS